MAPKMTYRVCRLLFTVTYMDRYLQAIPLVRQRSRDFPIGDVAIPYLTDLLERQPAEVIVAADEARRGRPAAAGSPFVLLGGSCAPERSEYLARGTRSRGGHVYDEWVKRSFDALATLVPARYAKRERSEDVVTALY